MRGRSGIVNRLRSVDEDRGWWERFKQWLPPSTDGDTRMPGTRFYLSGTSSAQTARCRRRYGIDNDDRWTVFPSPLASASPDGSGDRALKQLSQGIARHVNDLFMGILGQCALSRLDLTANGRQAAALSVIEDLVQYGAHLGFHLLGLTGRGIFADPPYRSRTPGLIGLIPPQFRSFPFHHLSTLLVHTPLPPDALDRACRHLSQEYGIVFDHLWDAINDLPLASAHPRKRRMKRLITRGRRLVRELGMYGTGVSDNGSGGDGVGTSADVLRRILRGVAGRVSEAAPNVRVTLTTGITLPAIRMTAGDFGRVIAAVVQNAVDAMPNGGRLTVCVDHRIGDAGRFHASNGPCLEVSVSDTGSGIPAADMGRVVEPFFTASATHGAHTGMGLTGVLGRLRQVNGGMALGTLPGRGTVVLMRIPAALPPASIPFPVVWPAPVRRLAAAWGG